MRPQLGSPPAQAHLTRVEFAMASAAARAAFSVAAPVTSTSTKRETPSPSLTIMRAKARVTSSKAASKTLTEGVTPLRPLASKMTVSLVLMSPSMVMRLKEFATERRREARRAGCEIAASVVTTQSMVAMFGSIIPAPLAIPPMRNMPSGVLTSTANSFAKVSLVMMDAAAALLPVGVG